MRFIKWSSLLILGCMLLLCGACGLIVVVVDRVVYISAGDDVVSIDSVPNDSVRFGIPRLPPPNNNEIFIGPYPQLAAQINPGICRTSRRLALNYGLATIEVREFNCR